MGLAAVEQKPPEKIKKIKEKTANKKDLPLPLLDREGKEVLS